MPTITDIKQQVKNPNELSVFIDGKYTFSLTLDQLADNKEIRISHEVTEDQINEYKKLSKLTNQYIRMVNLIYARPRSEQEVRLKLKLKKVDPDEIEELITKLKSQNLLNDQNFANWWVEGRKNSRSTSKRKLQSELAQKGVKPDLAGAAIEEYFSQDDELASLKKLIEKKKDKYPDQQKLMTFLASKGFNYSTIKEALSADEDIDFKSFKLK